MGNIVKISKGRKERKCSKCGKVIEKGQPYLKGVINFNPDIVRCMDCNLQHWEVTTSEYLLRIGELRYNWQDTHGCEDGASSSIAEEIQEIRDELQDRFDNIPEGLQSANVGTLLEERMDELDCTINDLEQIDYEQIWTEIFDEYDDEDGVLEHIRENVSYADEILEKIGADPSLSGMLDDLVNSFEETYANEIETAFENISEV